MGRSGPVSIRNVSGDKIYGDKSIAKFINCLMYDGKKQIAENIVYKALTNALSQNEGNIVQTFKEMLVHAQPLRVTSKRVLKGRTVSLPKEISEQQRVYYAIKNIIQAAREHRKSAGVPMSDALAQIFKDTLNNTGKAVDKKKSAEAAAEANRAYKVV